MAMGQCGSSCCLRTKSHPGSQLHFHGKCNLSFYLSSSGCLSDSKPKWNSSSLAPGVNPLSLPAALRLHLKDSSWLPDWFF